MTPVTPQKEGYFVWKLPALTIVFYMTTITATVNIPVAVDIVKAACFFILYICPQKPGRIPLNNVHGNRLNRERDDLLI
jgi:hypothetical protein